MEGVEGAGGREARKGEEGRKGERKESGELTSRAVYLNRFRRGMPATCCKHCMYANCKEPG